MDKKYIVEAIHTLNLANQSVCIHASLKSFGHVAGGCQTIIDAFLESGGTILVPSFTYHYLIRPETEIKRNGIDYAAFFGEWIPTEDYYRPETTEIAADLGAFPRAVVENPARVRGNNPINSFTALGPRAAALVAAQSPTEVYAPIRRLYEEKGAVLMMGTDLTAMTALHYAEQMAGRNPFVRWARDRNGKTIEVLTGSCSEGFHRFDRILAQCEERIKVGNSLWRKFPAKRLIELAATAIREDGMITHCGNPDCERCNDAVAGGPIID